MDNEEYRKKIEKEILEIIEQRLKARQMNAKRAKEIAQYILNTLKPHIDINQIMSTAKNFDKHFPELSSVTIDASNDYESLLKATVLSQAENLIKQNKIMEADTILKKALNKVIKF